MITLLPSLPQSSLTLNSASTYFLNPLSVLLYSSSPHPVVAGWSSSCFKLWWVLWNLGSSSLKVSYSAANQASPQIFNHFGHLMWASAQIYLSVLLCDYFTTGRFCNVYLLLFSGVSSHLWSLSHNTYSTGRE